jgi:hypothetical protein
MSFDPRPEEAAQRPSRRRPRFRSSYCLGQLCRSRLAIELERRDGSDSATILFYGMAAVMPPFRDERGGLGLSVLLSV